MHTYIIGEVGQNHNGSIDIAKLIIDTVSREVQDEFSGDSLDRIDAVKFTKRDLDQELSASQMQKRYDGPNSFGKTYGEHGAFLEFTDEQHAILYNYAKEKGLDFVETLCATGCLSLLRLFTPDYLKVASRDLTNIPLLAAMAETRIPMIVSTGMAGKKELDEALSTITHYHNNVSILHCVSEYPTQPINVNLRSICFLEKHYPQFQIGFSDHTIGISHAVAAVAMGAKVIEKHVTIDRYMKGTDQIGSLGPDGVRRMIRDIRIMEKSLGKEEIFIAPSVELNRIKLERSIAARVNLPIGHIIREGDLHLLSPGDGFKWNEREFVLGKKVIREIPKNEIIYQDTISEP